jgi:hypothetical protein
MMYRSNSTRTSIGLCSVFPFTFSNNNSGLWSSAFLIFCTPTYKALWRSENREFQYHLAQFLFALFSSSHLTVYLDPCLRRAWFAGEDHYLKMKPSAPVFSGMPGRESPYLPRLELLVRKVHELTEVLDVAKTYVSLQE